MSDIILRKHNEAYIIVDTQGDRGILQEVSDAFTFEVPGAKFMPKYRAGIWDGKIRLCNMMTGHLYAGLASYVEDFCRSRNYTIEYAYDNGAENFSIVEAEAFLKKQDFTLTPRDYQTEAFVDAIRYHRSLFLSPTASGKSFIIYMILRWHLKRTLVIVPTVSLVHQMSSDFESYGFNSDKYVHKIYSGQDKDTKKPVVITTWQSIYKLQKKWFEDFDVVIGDEAHLFKADSLTKILTKLENCKYRFGFTGTLDDSKTHRLVLEGLFGPVRQVTTTKKLIDEKHLAEFDVKIITLNYKDEEKKLVSKLDYHKEMQFLVGHEVRNNFIKNLALSLKGNTLLLFQFVDTHGQILYNRILEECGEDRKVFFVYGGVSGEDREEMRAIVEKEDNAIIVGSYGTLSTGVNIKNLHSIIFASPSKSKIRNLQSIGRSLRRSDTKDSATLYDIADNLTHKKKMNFTLRHLIERVKIYTNEEFPYKYYNVNL